MNPLSAAIYNQLVGGTALTALLGDGTAGIFEDHAGDAANLPYVVFNQHTGQWSRTMGEHTRFLSMLYQVQAVSGSAWPQEAGAIDAQIDARLHGASLTVSGYGLMRCVRESDISYAEVEDSQTFQHVGALYRVELQKT